MSSSIFTPGEYRVTNRNRSGSCAGVTSRLQVGDVVKVSQGYTDADGEVWASTGNRFGDRSDYIAATSLVSTSPLPAPTPTPSATVTLTRTATAEVRYFVDGVDVTAEVVSAEEAADPTPAVAVPATPERPEEFGLSLDRSAARREESRIRVDKSRVMRDRAAFISLYDGFEGTTAFLSADDAEKVGNALLAHAAAFRAGK